MILTAAITAAVLVLVLSGCQKANTGSQTAAPEQAADTVPPAPAANPAPVAPVAPVAVQIPAKTALKVRLDQALSTARNRAGDRFRATLEAPVNVGGREVLPIGAHLTGHVTTSRPSGRFKGRAILGITLDSVEYRGQAVLVKTSLDTRTSDAHKKRNAEIIGGGGGLGALIGAVAGGAKGAAIGAAAGVAAGTGGAFATGKKQVEIPAEAAFTFRLRSAVELSQ